MVDAVETQYRNCHPRTRWYLHEIAYCLERYFGYSHEAAQRATLTAPEYVTLVGCAIDDEQLFWHHLPLVWAYKTAVKANPDIGDVSPAVELEYQESRYFRPPPDAELE